MQKGPTGVFKSVLDTTRTDGKRRDEIFVDVVERLTCVFNASGYMQSSQIDGAIQVSVVSFCFFQTGFGTAPKPIVAASHTNI